MKIMFCLGAMTQGGAQRVVTNLSDFFINQKNEVSIVVTKKSKDFYKINDNVKLISLDKNTKPGNIIKRTINRIKALKSIIKEENPDIILSFLPEPTFRVMIANISLKKKVIISVRNDPNVLYNNIFKKMIVKLLYTKANGFVFQTPDAQKWFSKKIQKKSIVIPNPIGETFIGEPYTGPRLKTIVNVARIAKQKRHDLLIDSFYEVNKKHPEYTLKLYGDGDCGSLKKQVDNLDLGKRVHFMGEVSNIKDEIYKASMFVLPSDYEGMPNALMEAMALGIPCISTDCPCGGPKFLIKDKVNGLLVPVGEKGALIKSMNYIIENPEEAKKLGINANKICSELNPQIINEQWEKYIKEVIREN